MRGAPRCILAAFIATSSLVASAPAAADVPAASSSPHQAWHTRYAQARAALVEGEYREAEVAFRALAAEAESAGDRALALEMAHLAAEYADRVDSGQRAPTHVRRDIRSTDELTLLYGTALLYGAGTGTWFLLLTQPDSAVTATLPFAALTAAPAIGIAAADGYRKLRRGVPHAISAGLYLGLAEGVWLVGFQHARGTRIRNEDSASQYRWSPESTTGVLWAGATAGAIVGGVLGNSLTTTPGRVSFVASTTLWAGAMGGLASGALLADDARREERAFLGGGIALNAGLVTGLALAATVSPSVARVRIVDLTGLGGAVVATGAYLSLTSGDVDVRLAEGLAALGIGAGLTTGWLLTSGMPKARPEASSARKGWDVSPTWISVRGGGALGVGGLF